MMSVLTLLLGRRLSNTEVGTSKITEVEGVPAMGLDALSSAAYGPEAALTILLPLGAAGLTLILPIMVAILVLLAVVFFSYWQTIEAYPSNGGSYTVASENLGHPAGLLAGTALMVDYILNVAVGISAGVAALSSAIPALHPWTLPLCLAVLAVIVLVNLRGTQEAGLAWSLPTYLFVVCWVALLTYGLALVMGGQPQPVVKPPPIPPATQTAGAWLVLRAFAAGCAAMTGVEAVSNSVNTFRQPAVRHARRTLASIVVLLAMLLLVIAMLAHAFTIGAMDQNKPGYQSVLSQLAAAMVGRGPIYDIAIGSVLAVLCLSANTSFVGFPRVCRLLARDEYLPHSFALPGRRLVYSLGILFLGGAAAVLLIAFGGITDKLIPLFAVGAFLSFTLSQAGMAVHWTRELRKRPTFRVQAKRFINGLGAIATGVALAIIIVAKFVEGAWITIVVIPVLFLLMDRIRRRFATVRRQLRYGPMDHLRHNTPPAMMLPMETWNAITAKALHFAMRLSRDVLVVHLSALEGPDAEEDDAQLHREWQRNVTAPAKQAGLPVPRLVVLRSEYREFLEPLKKIVQEMEDAYPDRPIGVLIPEVVKVKWWDYLLYTYRARQLETAMLRDAGPRVVVIAVPWRIVEE